MTVIAEKLLYQHIEDNPGSYLVDGEAMKGDIAFYPDDNYAGMADDAARLEHMVNQVRLEAIEPSGSYPDWTPPKPFVKNGYGGSNKVSIEDKLLFLKKELAETVNTHSIRENKNLPIAAYILKIIDENADNERFIVTYFDLVKALIS